MKKILISTFLVLVLITGCGKVPKLKNGQEAIVTMKGQNISADDLYSEIKDKSLSILLDMIDKSILEKKYNNKKEEEEYVKNQVDSQKYYYEAYLKEQFSSFQAYLNQNGFETEKDLEEYFALNYKKSLAIKDYAKSLVTDKEIKKYYQDEIFGDITTSHILVAPDYKDGATEEEIAKAEKEALDKAKNIIKELNNGKDFKELITEYSKDKNSKISGEELPAFNKGQQSEEYEKASLELKVGKYTTTPVKDEYGYHIILKTKQADKPKLEDVKDEIITTLSEEKMDKDNFQELALIEIRKQNDVEIQDDSLKKQYETYVKNLKNQ